MAEINRSGTYLITDGGSQASAIVTQRGVILVDVPEPLPFSPPLQVVRAIAEITDKPITHLIYSHAHTDHIGGASTVVEAFPNVRIIAHKRTKDRGGEMTVLSVVEPLLAKAAGIRLGIDLARADVEPALHEFVEATLPERVGWR